MTSIEDRAAATRVRTRRCLGFLRLLFLLLPSAAALAQEKPQCTLPDCDQAKAFFQKFQQAVDTDKKQEVVGMIRYPLNSYRKGKATVFKTKAQVLAGYGTVFTAGVRCAIKTATLDDVWVIGVVSVSAPAPSGGTGSFPTQPPTLNRPIYPNILSAYSA